MPLPGAVFSSRVPVGLWLVMLVAKVDAALAVEVISWRMGVCVTMAVETGTAAAAAAGAGRAGWIGVAAVFDGETVVEACFNSTEVRAGR